MILGTKAKLYYAPEGYHYLSPYGKAVKSFNIYNPLPSDLEKFVVDRNGFLIT